MGKPAPTANDNSAPYSLADAVCVVCGSRIECREGSIYTEARAFCGPLCADAAGMRPWVAAGLVERAGWPSGGRKPASC